MQFNNIKRFSVESIGVHKSFKLLQYAIAMTNDCKNILEIGTREGSSTFAFLEAAHYLGGVVTSVDIADVSFTCPIHLSQYWNFVKSDSIAYLESLKECRFDLIYLDDWHSYPHVKRELELLYDIITPSTIILVHDAMANTSPEYNYFNDSSDNGEFGMGGVAKAITELDIDKWEYVTIPVQHGLSILRKK